MPKGIPNPKANGALCHCGRPLGHTGHHVGSRLKTGGASTAATNQKLRAILEAEIAACHEAVRRLKGEVRDRQAKLAECEAKLGPLVQLLSVYIDLALPAPAADTAARPTVAPPAVVSERAAAPPPRQVIAKTAASVAADASGPVEADLMTIAGWAGPRGLACVSFDDLPAINRKREQLGLPPFKALLGRRPPAQAAA